ncbi:unnamed protein product [Allacma fusca]|uniref:G-protein coupled receptors family 1 profile domain-containing protein n=1 Tax=Allacma fusca TaxID=39272 RepID=A0A8J2KSJ4_9HEXA|nr:unnamed protein product [Allacma fusca]
MMKGSVEEFNYLNVSCDEVFDLLDWKDAKVLSSLLVLAFINIVVIVGNCLVILAVFISTKLRTVTNLFIVSLAVADLMVGIAVLPFSATWEIFEIWIFGELWCSMWLAVDVWMCTASILNLCAISLDRYVAVTRPVTYPSIMSSKKAKILIGAVWVLSFLICFPPLVGWNDRKRTYTRQPFNNSTMMVTAEDKCTLTCELTNDKGYVVYSAVGSFFLPMFVMLFFYWRIYRAAVETTRAINQGFRTTKGSRLLGTRFEEQRLTLRIHRGRSVQNHHHRSNSPKPISPSNGRLHSTSTSISRSRSHERINVHLTPPPRGKRSSSYKPRATYNSNFSPSKRRTFHATSRSGEGCSTSTAGTKPMSCRQQQQSDTLNLPMTAEKRRLVHASESESSTPSPSPTLCAAANTKYETLSSSSAEDAKPKLISKMGKRNIKAQVKRFRMETKAAKTLDFLLKVSCAVLLFT